MTSKQQGQVEKSPGSALAILLGVAFAVGLVAFALMRKPAPRQPVAPVPDPQAIETTLDPAPPELAFPAVPTAPPKPPPPPPVAELVGEQSTDRPELVPIAPPVAKPSPAPDEKTPDAPN